ncbi:ABC-type branched-subunit amino acid transport system ATPase component [Bradyrhizobium sp. LM2.7]
MTGETAPLALRDVTSGYGDVAVIRRASMAFAKCLITTIVGSNGAGKSTAIKVAAGLLRAWQGSVWTNGIDITREPADRRVHRGIAYVPQGRIVVPEMTVRDNLMIGAHILGNDRRAIEAATERVLDLFPALKPRMKQHADIMSGGEQQMLAIGRALMTSPKVIMLDEPSLGPLAQICGGRVRASAVAARPGDDRGDGRAEGVACATDLRPRLCHASRPGRL